MKLRLALIGQGNEWLTKHQPTLRLLQDRFEVRAVYHSVAVLADLMARELRAQPHLSFREMLARNDVDAVLLLESDWYGFCPLYAACEHGKAIFCSSEIALEGDEANRLRAAADRAGIAFWAELPRRYAPATLRLKELIATRLGTPQLLFCHRRLSHDEPANKRNNPSLERRSQRELLELIDWCRYIVGEDPCWVQAISHPSPNDAENPDYQILSLGFGPIDSVHPKTLAQISCGSYIPSAWHEAVAYRPPAAVQVCCEQGLAFLDLPNSLVWFDKAGRQQESLDSEMTIGLQLMTQFHRSVTSLVRKVGGLDDLFYATRVLQAARQSMLTGQRQSIPEELAPVSD